MSWQVIVALVIAVPVVLLPVAFVWYLNSGGVFAAIRVEHAQRATKAEKVEAEKSVPK
jgi:hypothetical protein